MMASNTGSYYFSSTCSVLIRCNNWGQLLIVLAQFHSELPLCAGTSRAAAAAAVWAVCAIALSFWSRMRSRKVSRQKA